MTDPEVPDDEIECLASHCPPSMYVDCEYPKCAPWYDENKLSDKDPF